MQNIRKRIFELEELELKVVGEEKRKVRDELDRLRRIVLYFSKKTQPIKAHQIEYDTFSS